MVCFGSGCLRIMETVIFFFKFKSWIDNERFIFHNRLIYSADSGAILKIKNSGGKTSYKKAAGEDENPLPRIVAFFIFIFSPI